MRTGPLYQTARFDAVAEIISVHDRPTIPAPAPEVLCSQLTEREYNKLADDEIDIALESLTCIDAGWF